MTKSVKSKLISKGSSGCVFRPQIPCKKHIKTKKKSKKSITKLMISQDNQEYNFNEIIKKIKDYQKWTVLWNDKCKSSSYKELLKYTDIEKCLSNVGHIKYHKDHQFLLYQGSYAGVNMNDYCNKNITKQILTNKTKFNKFFLKLFRLVKNVFYGLTQLYNHNICHHDITIKNILIKNSKSYIIDYDISLKIEGIKKNKFLKKRMIDEYSVPRIFEAYPFEYLYYRINIVPIKMPALRNKIEDIKDLSLFFLKLINNKNHSEKFLSPNGMLLLKKYLWPGNIRELKNVVERLCLLSSTDEITNRLISKVISEVYNLSAHCNFQKNNLF